MFIIWIVLSVLIFFIIVETAISMWLNSESEKAHKKMMLRFKAIQSKFTKKKAS